MLSNAYFLAKFRFDTAENEPAKNLQNLLISTPRVINIAGHAGALPGPRLDRPGGARRAARLRDAVVGRARGAGGAPRLLPEDLRIAGWQNL